MAFSNPDKKRVRIQSGQQGFIKRQGSRPHRRSVKKSIKMRKMRSAVRRSRDQPHWNCKTHRPTVSQIVYQFLERASNSSSAKSQKSNATNQFRQLQRRNNSKRPDLQKRIRPKLEAMEVPREEYRFPYSKMPSHKGEQSIERCIYEVLTFGTILGLLEPADKEGMTFRVSSDMELFKDENKKELSRKRKFKVHDDDCTDKKYYNY